MGKANGHNTANGIISAIVTVCGIIMSVLISVLLGDVIELYEETRSSYHESTLNIAANPFWTFGFGYIVPGVIGMIAAGIKAKGAYITHMVFSILSLLGMGVFFIGAIMGLSALAVSNPGACYSSGDFCKCSGMMDMGYTCEELNKMYAMGVGICAMIVVGWIFTLVITILSGILSCRQEEGRPGMIIQQMPPTTTVLQLAPNAAMAPAYAAYPSYPTYPGTNDKAGLIPNAQY